jgi:subtilisin family serine protease
MRRAFGLLAITICSTLACGAAEVQRPVYAAAALPGAQPDRIGGYSSSAVQLYLRAGVAPAADGQRTLALQGVADDALAQYLAGVNAAGITPIFAMPFGDEALARSLGMDRMFRLDLPRGSDVIRIATDLATLFPHLLERTDLDGIASTTSVMPNDPSFNLQYGLHNTGQVIQGRAGTPDADIDAPEAYALAQGNGNVRIAIVDTGLSSLHADLAGKVADGRNFTSSVPGDYGDRNGHGTHCGGISAALTNNGIGIAGTCWSCSLLGSKVLGDTGGGQWTWVAAGVQWAADQRGVRVLSMSLGGGGNDAATTAAIDYAIGRGHLVVVAAGNAGGGAVIFPGRLPQVFTVSATNNIDGFAEFSSRGPEVDISAPGEEVYSTYATPSNPNTYTYLSGTSMATPHVAGLAGLLFSVNPRLTAAQVRSIIETTSEDKGVPGRDNDFGAGRINAARAVAAARATLCRADFNGNGTADFFDYLDFVQAFSNNAAAADFNGNGTVDFFDYLDFVQAFDAGCP